MTFEIGSTAKPTWPLLTFICTSSACMTKMFTSFGDRVF